MYSRLYIQQICRLWMIDSNPRSKTATPRWCKPDSGSILSGSCSHALHSARCFSSGEMSTILKAAETLAKMPSCRIWLPRVIASPCGIPHVLAISAPRSSVPIFNTNCDNKHARFFMKFRTRLCLPPMKGFSTPMFSKCMNYSIYEQLYPINVMACDINKA